MKKITILSIVLLSNFMFSQTDISKKEAEKIFKNQLQNPISERGFEKVWKQAKCIKKNHSIMLKDMPIFQKNPKYEMQGNYGFQIQITQYYFGLGEVKYPKYDDFGNKTITCNAFDTY